MRRVSVVMLLIMFMGLYSSVIGAGELDEQGCIFLSSLWSRDIGEFAGEISGVTYCSSTNNIYTISDKDSYISQFTVDGSYIQNLGFSDDYDDIEAIACNDQEGLIYIASEGDKLIIAFQLEEDQTDLIEQFKFRVATGSSKDSFSGIEGLTVNDATGDIYVSNEKEPRLIIRLDSEGNRIDYHQITFLTDISGMAYDDVLNMLWVISDQDERLFLVRLDGTLVDFWDVDLINPEGVAVNNNVTPPILYIVTDPFAPTGPQSLPLITAYEKPVQGTGYQGVSSYRNFCDRSSSSSSSSTSFASFSKRNSDSSSGSVLQLSIAAFLTLLFIW